ncbi:MAG: response regulator [Lachnospiraceae bacterium]|nr:response regulator [Lachnospiraceae bacterium]
MTHGKSLRTELHGRRWMWLPAGALIMAVLFWLTTWYELVRISDVTDEAFFFVEKRLEQYDNNLENDRVRSLYNLADKTAELSRHLDRTGEETEALIARYVYDQRLDGVVVTDETLACIWQTAEDGYEMWRDTICSGAVSEIIEYPAKIYMSRFTVDGEEYDFAAAARPAGEGLVIAYKKRETGSVVTIDSLFTGYMLENDGIVVITDEENVISSNVGEWQNWPLENDRLLHLKKYTLGGKNLKCWNTEIGRWYGKLKAGNGYTLYVMFPESSVFTYRKVIMACSIVAYIFAWFLADRFRIRLVRANMKQLEEQYSRELDYQKQLKEQAEQAQRANMAKTDFLRRMSHDIRTPINGIMGMVPICRRYVGDPGKQEECFEKITTASGYLLDLVNDVLDMNKLESGQIKLEQNPITLSKLMQEVHEIIRMQALEAGVAFTVVEEEIIHDELIGSSVHLKRVLQNIESNAVKYNREKGTVTVSCRETKSDGVTAEFEFICADTGIGMSEEFQKHAFEPFEQENGASRTSYAGTGLGLAIAKNIVEQMGGSIRFVSRKDEGTTFYITLPFEINQEAQQEAEQKKEKVSVEGLRILLVEDNDLNMEIARFVLEEEGVIITEARNGQEALDLYAASEPYEYDAVLMDIMMPVMDGLEAARRIRRLPREDAVEVPIIAMSANAFADDMDQSLEAGMDAHISKPLNVEELIATIGRYCKGRKEQAGEANA